MRKKQPRPRSWTPWHLLFVACAVACQSKIAAADEWGVSFWLPGQNASFAAVPFDPGWSLTGTLYHETTRAGAGAAFQRGASVEAGLRSRSNYFMLDIAYTFKTPIAGATAAVGVSALLGTNAVSASATLAGPGGSISGRQSDSLVGVGDLLPIASLYWTAGSHNFMLYGTVGIPVGTYNSQRLAAIGLGHWAVDTGGGYTYWNEESGIELSAVLGFTYNFTNPDTQYRSGIDAHLDWAASYTIIKDVQLGVAGYVYHQLTGDSGSGNRVGDFKSRVMGIGPELILTIPVGSRKADLSFRGYKEFDARNRMEGWNVWAAFAIAL